MYAGVDVQMSTGKEYFCSFEKHGVILKIRASYSYIRRASEGSLREPSQPSTRLA